MSAASSAGRCLVVMYHYVRDSAATPYPGIRALSPELFAQQLDWLERDYDVIDVDRFEAAVDGQATLPANAALLTFDDGLVDHHETVLPMLAARNLTGVFFVAGAALEAAPRVLNVHKTQVLIAALGADAFGRAVMEEWGRTVAAAGAAPFGRDVWDHPSERALKSLLSYEMPLEDADRVLASLFGRHIGDETAFARDLYLSPAQMAEMSRAGMRFGYHTYSHRMLSRLSADEQRRELQGGVERVRALTGQTRVSFCYPWGGAGTYTPDTLAVLADAGYSVAFNTVRRVADPGVDGRFEVPRLDTRDLPPHADAPDLAAAAQESES